MRLHRRPAARLAAAALVALVTAPLAPVPATAAVSRPAPHAEALVLDPAAGGDTTAPRVAASTRGVWPAGTYAVVVARGTFGRWAAANWRRGVRCGHPEPSAIYPSTLLPTAVYHEQGYVGQDPEVLFAEPNACIASEGALPRPVDHFRIDAGSGSVHPAAVGGPYTAPRADHTYAYVVRGQGARLHFRIADDFALDNYGLLSILVRPAVRSDCAGAGWQAFGGAFADRNACAAALPGVAAARLPGPTLVVTGVPHAVRAGATAAFAARVSGAAGPVTTARVALWVQAVGGSWRRAATLRPSASGIVLASVRPRVSARYQFRLVGSTVSTRPLLLQVRG
ncbi:hypothetical protein EV189_1095 [Motilibacter rhizosphaerae]|uniref:Uncharacterized protein n=1 Tax=Motilibacter rhizosphaerae TaxID=598652 RepID=A0A4Q7NWX6_9ACTN|nr:hypothetical protein [Motilibacter rhizosphaerae]RZS91843.1 hypothetical protein EV189_1095 [Motilibacter rhizosphaerae]